MSIIDLDARLKRLQAVLTIHWLGERGHYVVRVADRDCDYDVVRVGERLEPAIDAALGAFEAWFSPRRVMHTVADGAPRMGEVRQ
jgi:hypothetical protein